jgi:CHAD domain-containing protein
MRVATRRLRAALQVVEPVYDPAQIRRSRRGLRRVAAALADMRDLDVFRAHVVAYWAALPEETQAGVAPLLAAIEAGRTKARALLLEDLKARRYRKFKRAFAMFLTTPGADLAERDGAGATARVRDFAGSAIWRRYEQWRVYETILAAPTDEALHNARIAGKRLRYTLEFFADALGPNVETVLAPLVALQENLGALQDAVAARKRVQALGLHRREAIDAYLQARDLEHAAYFAELPRRWEKVASATYRRRLMELIVKL